MTEEQQKLYDKHLNVMFGSEKVDDFNEDKVNEVYNNLLKCLPNNGKLYKYRTIKTEDDFNKVFSSLNEGFLWSSRADEFFDKTDCTINYILTNDISRIEQLIIENPLLIAKPLINAMCKELGIEPNIDNVVLNKVIACYNINKYEFDINKSRRLFYELNWPIEECLAGLNLLNSQIKPKLEDIKPYAKKISQDFVNFNKLNRHNAFVCSLCEDYSVKSMWDNYGKEQGICIEYDYKKLLNLTNEDRKFFNSIYKVEYNDVKEETSLVSLFITYINDLVDTSENKEQGRNFLNNTITKSEEYSYEKEWRLFHYFLTDNDKEKGAKLKIDLVSCIIINEETLSSRHGIKIIDLCKKKGWDIKIRVVNNEGTKYNFVSYDEYLTINKCP